MEDIKSNDNNLYLQEKTYSKEDRNKLFYLLNKYFTKYLKGRVYKENIFDKDNYNYYIYDQNNDMNYSMSFSEEDF